MTLKAFACLFCTMGMGAFTYRLIPAVVLAGTALAQGSVPDASARDWANLGGFAVFAFAMWKMNREDRKAFREDLKAERDQNAKQHESMIAAIGDVRQQVSDDGFKTRHVRRDDLQASENYKQAAEGLQAGQNKPNRPPGAS